MVGAVGNAGAALGDAGVPNAQESSLPTVLRLFVLAPLSLPSISCPPASSPTLATGNRSLTMHYPHRSISLCASLASALFNSFCALRILLSWRSLSWDFSGVDDTDSFPVNIDALHLLWGLLTLYFAAAATASAIGFVGIARVCSPSGTRRTKRIDGPHRIP